MSGIVIAASPGFVGSVLVPFGELLTLLAVLRVIAEVKAELAVLETRLLPFELGLEGEDVLPLLQERNLFN